MACRDCICVTEEIALVSGSAAVISNIGSSQRSSLNSASRATDSFPPSANRTPEPCSTEAMAMALTAQDGSNSETCNLIRGAVFRAMCLIAGHGLLDPVDGPRAAAESMVISLLSHGGCRLPKDPTTAFGVTIPVEAETSDIVSNKPVAEGAAGAAGAGRAGERMGGSMDRMRPAAELLGSPRRCLRLRDIRWGLDTLLMCLAIDIGNELELIAPPDTMNIARAAEAKNKVMFSNAHEDEETQDHKKTTLPNHHGLRSHSMTAKKRAVRALKAYGLVESACRESHIGPTLVASILLAWIPHLRERRWPTSREAYAVADRGVMTGRTLQSHPVNELGDPAKNKGLRKQHSTEGKWSSSDAGEHEAAAVLVVGAIRMLVFMVKSYRLVQLSEFSAAKLALVGEVGIALGTNVDGGKETSNVRHSMGGRARAAGETLIKLLLNNAEEGLEVLLPVLTNTRGVIHLQQTAVSAPPHGAKAPSTGAEAVQEERGHINDGSMLTFETKDGDTNFVPGQGCGRVNVEVRSRLKIPAFSSPSPALSPQGEALSSGSAEAADDSRGFEGAEDRQLSEVAPEKELDGPGRTTTAGETLADTPPYVPRASVNEDSSALWSRDSEEAPVHHPTGSLTDREDTPPRSSGRSGNRVFPLSSDGMESSEGEKEANRVESSRSQMERAEGHASEKEDIDGTDDKTFNHNVDVIVEGKLEASDGKPKGTATEAAARGGETKVRTERWVSKLFSFRFGRK